MRAPREPRAEKAALGQEPSAVNMRESVLCEKEHSEGGKQLLPKSGAGGGLFRGDQRWRTLHGRQDRWASVQKESWRPQEATHCNGSPCSGVCGVRLGVGGCGKVAASWGCELPKGLLTLDTQLRQRTTGCAHIHVPLQNCSKKKKKNLKTRS